MLAGLLFIPDVQIFADDRSMTLPLAVVIVLFVALMAAAAAVVFVLYKLIETAFPE